MYDIFADILSQVWEHRRNKVIAVGAIAMVFLGLFFTLKGADWPPPWLPVAMFAAFWFFSLIMILLVCYYILRGLVRIIRNLVSKWSTDRTRDQGSAP